MNQDELIAVFDAMAEGYDERWKRMQPIRTALHFLLDAVFADLPTKASVLCVGVGTGEELDHLARSNSEWQFTALDPSAKMLYQCRERAYDRGFYLRSVPIDVLSDERPFR